MTWGNKFEEFVMQKMRNLNNGIGNNDVDSNVVDSNLNNKVEAHVKNS